jgi:hypothetical protein
MVRLLKIVEEFLIKKHLAYDSGRLAIFGDAENVELHAYLKNRGFNFLTDTK